MKCHCLISALLLSLPVSAWSATPDIAPGEWEFVSRTEVDTAIELPDQTDTDRRCISADELESADFGFIDEQEGCELREQSVRADGLSYDMICRAEDGEAEIRGEMAFMGDTMEGTVVIESRTSMGAMTMNTRLDGERLGDCSE